MNVTRPTHPELARIFDTALKQGLEIRYADEYRVVTFRRRSFGCFGLILVIGLAIITLGLALIWLLGAAADKGGTVTTYELQPNGKIKITRATT